MAKQFIFLISLMKFKKTICRAYCQRCKIKAMLYYSLQRELEKLSACSHQY